MTAEPTYGDPSALLKLYLHEPESRPMAAWMRRLREPVVTTPHGRAEIVNALALALHRRLVSREAFDASCQALDADLEAGIIEVREPAWRAVFRRSASLSEAWTPTLGTRSLDVLHVASALELQARRFVTFDDRQAALAAKAGLRGVRPGK